MSEMGETPPEYIEEKNVVVEAARKGVRVALETNEAWKQYHDSLHVKEEKPKSVYRAWVDAADRVVGAMTEADRNTIGTLLYEAKMRVWAGSLQVSSAMADTVFNVVTWIPRKALLITSPVFGSALEHMAKVGPSAALTKKGAEEHASERIWKYRMNEAKTIAKEGGKFVKDQVGERVKQIVTGFAYPEGKQVKPQMAKA